MLFLLDVFLQQHESFFHVGSVKSLGLIIMPVSFTLIIRLNLLLRCAQSLVVCLASLPFFCSSLVSMEKSGE